MFGDKRFVQEKRLRLRKMFFRIHYGVVVKSNKSGKGDN